MGYIVLNMLVNNLTHFFLLLLMCLLENYKLYMCSFHAALLQDRPPNQES